MKSFFLFLLVLFFVGCDGKTQIQAEKIKLYILDYDSIKRIENYKLYKSFSDSTFTFNYKHFDNREKDFKIIYNNFSKTLKWSWDFEILENNKYFNKKFSDSEFDIYSDKENLSHKNKILFNKNYGVLGISNMWNPGLIFLKDDDTSLYSREIFKVLLK